MDAVYEGFDWEKTGSSRRGCKESPSLSPGLPSVAGSVGHISIRLAQRYPKLHFIVQDYEPVCRRGEAMLPVEVQNRVRFQPYDLFEWSDKYASHILRAVAAALKPGDRIILNEQIMPEPGTAAPAIEQLTRSSDMTMLSIFNGQERTKEQLRALVQPAHPGLHVLKVITPLTLALGIVEICLKDS
ncbi:S-adenosyl-L-methionine-dependent methyltransferase [Penicillium hordei]|uniref:S-adenosyl-L-methionine-dependent methyltransferase n=1 Tax=Penicillium hordei TaxID=40994 RepID=A0AAD6GYS1_9EURO|nr:S-adenosyl-L-methionine-dependent methyltransferase [Penicillium hordei]KAJ5597527.1 S-adenosyl-L-methionine-dependent methyltransferase [Penicillium hordei]